MGSLIFLDARDLIDCFEHERPIGAEELGRRFRAIDAKVVVTFTTIAELIPGGMPPLPEDVNRGVELVRKIGVVPHAYVRHATIGARELREIYLAWQQRRRPNTIDPFVSHFYKTTWRPALGSTDIILEDDATRFLEGLSVAEQIQMLGNEFPETLRWNDSFFDRLRNSVSADRERFGSKRGTRAAREDALKRHLIAGGMSEPQGGLTKFTKWVYADPTLAPGWRIGWDIWEEYRSNVQANPEAGDLRDFSYLAIIPYVTHFTIDTKWQDYAGRARKRRERDDLSAPYFDRIRANLADVLRSLDDESV